LHAPFGCLGVDVSRESACMPPGRHPAHVEQHTPLLSTNVFDSIPKGATTLSSTSSVASSRSLIKS
jgi:hypothetical protein